MYGGRDNYNQDPECAILIRKIPRELRRRFKGWCAARGETMTSVLRDLMYNCVTGRFADPQFTNRYDQPKKRHRKRHKRNR